MIVPPSEAPDREWLELSVVCDREAVEPVTELFAQYGYNEGVVIEEPFTQDGDGDNVKIDPTGPITVRTFVHAVDIKPNTLNAIRQGLWHLGQIRRVGALSVAGRREEDWATAWKEHNQVHRVGRRVVVKPPWRDHTPSSNEIVVELDPGMAFGTGLHPSTQLCMVALEDMIRPGDTVFDVGTGSGVLAIAAAKLGATRVDAVDIEPVAVRWSRENVERNGLSHVVHVEEGSVDPGGPFTDQYDLVLANIIARILIELASSLAGAVAPGGILVLSGIIESREPAVRREFDGTGLRFERRDQSEDWISLVYRRDGDRVVGIDDILED